MFIGETPGVGQGAPSGSGYLAFRDARSLGLERTRRVTAPEPHSRRAADHRVRETGLKETERVLGFWRLCREADARGNLVPDAYLAALAIESGSELVTADRDFRRFSGLRLIYPLTG